MYLKIILNVFEKKIWFKKTLLIEKNSEDSEKYYEEFESKERIHKQSIPKRKVLT